MFLIFYKLLYKNRNLILYYNIFVSLFLYIYIFNIIDILLQYIFIRLPKSIFLFLCFYIFILVQIYFYTNKDILLFIFLGFYMVVFRVCSQNGMGKIDELEGIFMSGVGQLVSLENGDLNGKIYSAENEKRENG